MKARKEIIAILTANGVSEPSNELVNALYKSMREDIAEEMDKYEASNVEKEKAIKDEYSKKYEGYVSKEDHQKALDEITSLKDASAKNDRVAKYKEASLNPKYYDFIDSKLKESKNLDEDLKKFVKENGELVIKTTTKEVKKENNVEPSFSFGAQHQNQNGSYQNPNFSIDKAVVDYYQSQKSDNQ